MKKISFIILFTALITGICFNSPCVNQYCFAQDELSAPDEQTDNGTADSQPQDTAQPDDESANEPNDETIDENDTSGIDPWFLENKDATQQPAE